MLKKVQRTLRIDIVSYFVMLMSVTIICISMISSRENTRNTFSLVSKIFEKSFLFSSTKIEGLFLDVEQSGALLVDDMQIKMERLNLLQPAEFKQFAQTLILNPYLFSVYISKSDGYFIQISRRNKESTFQDKKKGSIPDQAVFTLRVVEPNSRIEKWYYLTQAFDVISNENIEVSKPFKSTERIWYSSAVYKKEPTWSDVYIFKASQKPGLTFSFPIQNKDDSISGVLGMDMTVDSVNAFVNTLVVSENAFIVVLNDLKKIVGITKKNNTEIIKNKSISLKNVKNNIELNATVDLKDTQKNVRHYTDVKEKVVESIDFIENDVAKRAYYNFFLDNKNEYFFTVNNVEYIAYTNSFGSEKRKLYFSMHAPTLDFMKEVNYVNRESLIITFIVSIFAIIVLYILARRISDPIVDLTENARKIAKLEFPGKMAYKTHIYEIQDLAQSMNTLNKSIGMLSKYIPKNLSLKLIEKDGDVNIGGSVQRVTIFFSDIEGFTTISEQIPAEYLILHLSEYFENLTNIIIDQKGSIDKYIGDAIMALWGTPFEDDQQVVNACKAALLCQNKLVEMNERWGKLGKPALNTRIGLHTGDAVVGNIGSSERINFTAIGDNINLAARLEGLNKYYGTSIMVSQSIFEVAQSHFLFRILDKVSVKGKQKSVFVYELVCENSTDYMDQLRYITRAEEAFRHYTNRHWDQAIDCFESLRLDFTWGKRASEVLRDRCVAYKENPPEVSWQGEHYMSEK